MRHPLELSVVVPAFNEVLRLEASLGEIVTYLRGRGTSFELIVSDDGSTDGTADLVGRLGTGWPELALLSSQENKGKGHAVKLGVAAAVGERVLFCDADGATPIRELVALETGLREGAQIAVGSRALNGPGVERDTRLHRRVMGRIFSRIVTDRLAPGIRDTQCGFKLFTRDAAGAVAARLTVDGFGFDVEIFVIARRLGLEVTEVPVSWHDVDGSKVRLVRDSIKMVSDALAVRRNDRAGRYAD